jgi:glycosyltransferase involved in cell wall biosynthesis
MVDKSTERAVVGSKPDVSIVVPVYNEDQMIEGALRMILAVDFHGHRREIVVVNDGSSDRTQEVLKKFPETEHLRIIHREANGGKGAAVRDGIGAATGRVIIIQDADLEYDPSQIPALAKPILDGTATVVYGSRFKGVIRNMSATRRLANRFLTAYINLLFGSRITDACTCYKAIEGEMIRGFGLKSNGFEVCHEITANVLRRGHEIKELPISYCARTVDEGVKSSWKDFIKQLHYIFLFRFSPLNGG